MSVRSTVSEIVQIGVETTAGTAVAATKKLSAAQLVLGQRVDVSQYRPSGNKFPTVVTLNKEWTEGKISGPITYTELVYWLSSVLKAVTPTGTTAKTWVFAPSATSADTKKSFTVEVGQTERAEQAAYMLVTGLGLKFSRAGCELDGQVLAKKITDNHTLSSGTSDIALTPVAPPHVQYYLADTQAGLSGATAMARGFAAEFNIKNRYNAIWPMNGSSDWDEDVESVPDTEIKLKAERNAEGMALLSNLRSGDTKWLRISADNGVELETGVNSSLQIDVAVKVVDVSDPADEDDVQVHEWSMVAAYDSTWGKAFEVTVVNSVASL